MTRNTPSATHRFFVFNPEGDGFAFYKTAEERDAAAKEMIQMYLDSGEWSPEVQSVFSGEVTHRATEVNRVDRPDDLEDGVDGEGRYWPEDCDYLCKVEMRPASESPGVKNSEP